jgi:CBS domain-containing protein
MTLLEEIERATVGTADLRGFVTADEALAVREVLHLMCRYDRTTALITRDNVLCGIFTERDVLQKIISNPATLDRPVTEFMTPDPVTVRPDLSLLGALRAMNQGHFRDLPVVDDQGRVLGNLTDNAVVQHICARMQAEVINIPPDPHQVPRAPEGA